MRWPIKYWSVTRRGTSLVPEVSLRGLRMSVMAVAHRDERCAATPPSGAQEIANSVRNASVAEAKIIGGGRIYGSIGCSVGPHTFSGAEKILARHVFNFILANSRLRAAS